MPFPSLLFAPDHAFLLLGAGFTAVLIFGAVFGFACLAIQRRVLRHGARQRRRRQSLASALSPSHLLHR
jgi:hypothetical protein